jgi:hypothetical protein
MRADRITADVDGRSNHSEVVGAFDDGDVVPTAAKIDRRAQPGDTCTGTRTCIRGLPSR